jgi:hypothetical protein
MSVMTACGRRRLPGVNDPVGKVTSYYLDHRSAILLGEFIIGISVADTPRPVMRVAATRP